MSVSTVRASKAELDDPTWRCKVSHLLQSSWQEPCSRCVTITRSLDAQCLFNENDDNMDSQPRGT
jgi:hypothetical protein